jgi:MSHA pilin protein MshD
MTSIQMILALGAMILLTILITNVNKNSLHTEDVMYDSNFGITATSIASSIIEDASKKRFDHIYYTDSTAVYNVNNFTPAANLGIDSGEVATDARTFNDFDDYDAYTGIDSTMPSAVFSFSSTVNYINANDPDATLNTQSFHKKITVKVWSISMKDTMIMSSIYSYWSFLP